MPVENVIVLVVGIVMGSSGVIVGILGRASAARVNARVDVVEAGMVEIRAKCIASESFQKESAKDRGELRTDMTEMGGDIKVVKTVLEQMQSQLDVVYRKILNGGPR